MNLRAGKLGRWLAVIGILASILCALAPGARAGDLGVDVNADVDAFGKSQMDTDGLQVFAQHSTVYALPLLRLPPGDHARYWDSMVEQYQSAQIDFAAVWLKGNNQPATFANLVSAINRRGLAKRLKIMPFDDNPASWTALWNFNHSRGYGYAVPFDVSDPANWAWVWDKNLRAFFQAVPDANRYKIAGRPVYRIWSGAPAFLSHLDGNGSRLLASLRARCQSTFGFNPYIVVPEDWVKNDPSSDKPGVVDAVAPWFTPVPGPVHSTWNLFTWRGTTFGACIPQFHISSTTDPNAATWIVEPRHGQTLTEGLAGTAGTDTCLATFVEGFDDYWENATLWRARNLAPDGSPLPYAQTGYDYPNQRINLLRRYSRNPFPPNLEEAAAGCDTFSAAAPPAQTSPPVGSLRSGALMVENTTDTGGGTDVCRGRAGQTLQWQDVPMQGTVHLLARAFAGAGIGKLHCVVDGMARPPVAVPAARGGSAAWATVDLGGFVLARGSRHTVQLVCDTPGLRLHWWRLQTRLLPDGAYTLIPWPAPDTFPAAARRCTLRSLGRGRYAVRLASRASAPVQTWTITPQPDGFFSAAPARGKAAQPAASRPQEWSFLPIT